MAWSCCDLSSVLAGTGGWWWSHQRGLHLPRASAEAQCEVTCRKSKKIHLERLRDAGCVVDEDPVLLQGRGRVNEIFTLLSSLHHRVHECKLWKHGPDFVPSALTAMLSPIFLEGPC
eukprot:1146579-Pelagomonas_calceolata.AAC.3